MNQSKLERSLLSRIEDIGRAQEKLRSILDHNIFDSLSKHDPFWISQNEVDSEKLHDIRMQVSCLNDDLCDLYEILRKEEE